MPPRSHTKIEVGIVSCPGCSNTMFGLRRSPNTSQIALPNAFAPSNHVFHSGASHLGGTPQWSNPVRSMKPTAPSSFAYSPLSALLTTATAFAPASVTSCTASEPSPPEAPHTSTTSPSLTVFGGQPWSIRYAVAPVSVGAAASSHVSCSAFGRHWCAWTLQNCEKEPQHVSYPHTRKLWASPGSPPSATKGSSWSHCPAWTTTRSPTSTFTTSSPTA